MATAFQKTSENIANMKDAPQWLKNVNNAMKDFLTPNEK
jgi:hypothetical protein